MEKCNVDWRGEDGAGLPVDGKAEDKSEPHDGLMDGQRSIVLNGLSDVGLGRAYKN